MSGVDFLWATIEGTDTTIIGQGSSIEVNAPGTYYMIGLAANGCENAAEVTVLGDFNLPNANAGEDQSLDCYQTPIDLTGTSTTPNVSFDWSVNDPNIVITNPDFPTINVGEPGVYTLTVTQLDNNCQAIDEVVVDLYENVPQGQVFCQWPKL